MSNLSKKFDFVNAEGQTLSGRLELPSGPLKGLAIFAHCFTCSKNLLASTRIPRSLKDKGIGVLRFDFTGLGNSEGDFANTNFSSNVQDLLAANEALKKEYGAPNILIGHSLGGAAVLKAALELSEIKAVVTIGAPSDVSHVMQNFEAKIDEIESQGEATVNLAGREFKIKKQFIEDIREADILKGIESFGRKALLVMHSPVDNNVSIEHASNIFLKAKHPKSFVSLDQADHLVTNSDDAIYIANLIASWVVKYLDIKESEINLRDGLEKGFVRVTNREGQKFTHEIVSESHHIVADEPPSVGGADLGMTPYDLLLASLGSCTAMTMKMYAEHKKFDLQKVQVDLSHGKIHAEDCENCETKSGKIDQIVKKIHIEGNLSDEERAKIFEIAERCPVNRTLKSEINIVSEHL